MDDRNAGTARPDSPQSDLRRLLACPECRLQYDVSHLAVGSRFRCSCGQLMAVPRFEPHDARVVRCSSCGAPRQNKGSHCNFCTSDFTLHERDLHTICPGCFSRISDQARFCHSCGLAILPQAAAGEATEYACPACTGGPPLVSRNLGPDEVTVLECGGCAGLWMGHELFARLQQQALEKECGWLGEVRREAPAAAGGGGGVAYRRCPVCECHMTRRNFERRSGVILDSCASHGVWLDLGELDRLLRWIQRGGLTRARRAEERQRQREQAAQVLRLPRGPLDGSGSVLLEPEHGRKASPDFVRTLMQFFEGV